MFAGFEVVAQEVLLTLHQFRSNIHSKERQRQMTNPKILDPMMRPNALSMNANSNPKPPFASAIPRTYPTCHATPMCPLFIALPPSKVDLNGSIGRHHRRGQEGEPFYRDAKGFGTEARMPTDTGRSMLAEK
jgi:hypothetical protein